MSFTHVSPTSPNHALQRTGSTVTASASTLAERRPIDDLDCVQGMISNSNLTITAWNGELLVGVARSVTDFHYACYLSDPAVHFDYQRCWVLERDQCISS